MVFFLGEIVALLLYFYQFGKISSKSHLVLGWIYFGCAWASLFVINGVIDYMLTPGEWLNNPTFWPALFFRTFPALMIGNRSPGHQIYDNLQSCKCLPVP